jgi:hypothetical protein
MAAPTAKLNTLLEQRYVWITADAEVIDQDPVSGLATIGGLSRRLLNRNSDDAMTRI